MSKTIAVPESLLKKLSRATRAFQQLEDEIEDFLLLSNPEFLAKMRSARAGHLLLWVDHKERQITLHGVEHRRSVYDDI